MSTAPVSATRGPAGWNTTHVAGGKLQVLRLVALAQELVDVELGDRLAVAPQRDVAHRAVRARAARRDQRREQRRLARQRVDAGALRGPDDEDLDRAQLAERHAQVEVGEEPADLRPQVALELRGLDAGDVEAADLRQVEQAVAVDRGAVVGVDRAPGPQDHLVAGADGVVGGDRHVVDRVEGVDAFAEEARAEHRQQAAGRGLDEALELARLRRRPRLVALGRSVAVAERPPVGAERIAVAAVVVRGQRRLSAAIGVGAAGALRTARRIPGSREGAGGVGGVVGGPCGRDAGAEERQRAQESSTKAVIGDAARWMENETARGLTQPVSVSTARLSGRLAGDGNGWRPALQQNPFRVRPCQRVSLAHDRPSARDRAALPRIGGRDRGDPHHLPRIRAESRGRPVLPEFRCRAGVAAGRIRGAGRPPDARLRRRPARRLRRASAPAPTRTTRTPAR